MRSPFAGTVKWGRWSKRAAGAEHWVKPELVAEALVSAAQMNVIEFHTWNSPIRNIDKPDRRCSTDHSGALRRQGRTVRGEAPRSARRGRSLTPRGVARLQRYAFTGQRVGPLEGGTSLARDWDRSAITLGLT